jgi:hypothetical protein
MVRKYPTMFEIDFAQAREAITKAIHEAGKSTNHWAFRDGFQSYKDGKALRECMIEKYYADTRGLWRLGWITAMFIDLNNRDQIVMSSTVVEGKEDVLPD